VTQVGADDNEPAGLRTPFLTVPIATVIGWNLRDPATAFATDRTPFSGLLIPFAKPPYASRDEYLGRFTSETLRLIGERYLSAGDLQFVLSLAAQFWEWAVARP
jgi:Alpha/beta hydrolase domain